MKSLARRNMGLIIAGLVGTLVLAQSSSQAQFRRMSPDERAKALRDSLSLDSGQTAKVKIILEDAQSEMTSIREANQGDKEAMRSAMQSLAEKTDTKIKGILNDEQKAKYEQMVKNRQAMRRGMRGRE